MGYRTDPYQPCEAKYRQTSITTDILKHHSQKLEDTLVGRMLKAAGLIEPDFDDHLRNTLSKALNLYFETYPEYKLSGVKAFFQDPAIAKQIGDYILDRKPIDQDQIQQALDQHLSIGALEKAWVKQKKLDLKSIIPNFLKCYRQMLGEQLSVPQMAILLELVEQTETVIEEIRVSEDRMKAIVQHRLDSLSDKLHDIDANLQAIKQHLGLDRPQETIVEEIKTSLEAAPRGAMFESGGLCSGYHLQPMPDRYFVAQEFRADRSDLRNALTDALNKFNVKPVCSDDVIWAGHILCKLSAMIQSTPFGVYQLTTSQNRNVYLELGIAIGLNRPFVLVKDREAEVCSLAQGLEYYSIQSYLELRYELGEMLSSFMADIASYQPQKALPSAGSEETVVISHGGHEVLDFCVPVANIVAEHHLTPVILGDPTGKLTKFLEKNKIVYHIIGGTGRTRLDETVAAIQAARMGIYRIDKAYDPDTFVALGISMGLNRPGLLVYRTSAELPADLKGLSASEFKSYSDLERSLPTHLEHVLMKYH